jgi:hypothetical protein
VAGEVCGLSKYLSMAAPQLTHNQFRLFKFDSISEKGSRKNFLLIETLGSTIFGDFYGTGSAGTSQRFAYCAATERSGDGLLVDSFVARC